MTMLNRGLPDAGLARNAPIDSQNAYQRGSTSECSKALESSRIDLLIVMEEQMIEKRKSGIRDQGSGSRDPGQSGPQVANRRSQAASRGSQGASRIVVSRLPDRGLEALDLFADKAFSRRRDDLGDDIAERRLAKALEHPARDVGDERVGDHRARKHDSDDRSRVMPMDHVGAVLALGVEERGKRLRDRQRLSLIHISE